MEYLPFLLLFVVGYFFGTANEKKHFSSLRKRESDFLNLQTTTTKRVSLNKEIRESELISASVVISLDHFKRVFAGLRCFFGGNVSAYETLVDRARREAVLRLKEQVVDADLIANLRVETSAIGATADMQRSIGSIEALAYGTAVWYE